MSKASQLLDELKNLDADIECRIDELRTLEAGLLSSPKWASDKIKGGKPVKVDDVYAQLIVLKESIEQDTNEAINRKLELSRLINKVSNPKERAILRMTYILKQYPEDVMERLKISQSTYYRLRKHATEEIDIFLDALE
jgi:DNA-directed RNA polymerase specialized sigma subunit